MFGPREMLLSSNEPVVRQFLNAQREGPIGMAEEKDASELEAEQGTELGALPPIPIQLPTSSGVLRKTQRPPGAWLRDNGITPPAGSFAGLDVDVPGLEPTEPDAAQARVAAAAREQLDEQDEHHEYHEYDEQDGADYDGAPTRTPPAAGARARSGGTWGRGSAPRRTGGVAVEDGAAPVRGRMAAGAASITRRPRNGG